MDWEKIRLQFFVILIICLIIAGGIYFGYYLEALFILSGLGIVLTLQEMIKPIFGGIYNRTRRIIDGITSRYNT